MNLELHIIQNFAPSNLNRDDTGSPKSCEFGGYRRARISSQCIKRAIRQEFKKFKKDELVPAGAVAERSKRLRLEVARALSGHRGESEAQNAFDAGLAILGVLSDERGDANENDIRSEVLIFASRAQIEAVAAVCDRHWDELQELHARLWPAGKSKKPSKDAAKKLGTRNLKDDFLNALDAARSSDQALFGRMLAELPNRNIDAASQVAHAISTHQVNTDFDYYTAVDDLKPEDTAGADMIGTVEFNSACYYRYANIDLGRLEENLGGDRQLAEATVRAFLLASRDAVPTGKQNSFAAQNAPSFMFSVVRERGAWSLANAFVRPVRVTNEKGLVDASIEALDSHWGELTSMYGTPPGARLSVVTMGNPALPNLAEARVANCDDFLARTLDAARAIPVV